MIELLPRGDAPFSSIDPESRWDEVAALAATEASLAAHPDAFLTIPHFTGYAAALVHPRAPSSKPWRRRSLTIGSRSPTDVAEGYRRDHGLVE